MQDPAQLILPVLPRLRRFARALTGDAEAGDDLVAATVEEALADPEGRTAGDALALLAAMLRLRGPEGSRARTGGGPVHPLEAALAELPETRRRAFLLATLEGLDARQAADALGIGEDEAAEHVARARDAVGRALAARVLIVEDDALIARDLAETVAAMGHRVCGTAATPDEAVAVAEDDEPTLALVDLHLARGTDGKTTVRTLRARHAGLPVIFVTAFAEELERDRALSCEPVIRKPFTRDQIETAITRAVFAPREAA
jgi:CheY-like chemotaxis protein